MHTIFQAHFVYSMKTIILPSHTDMKFSNSKLNTRRSTPHSHSHSTLTLKPALTLTLKLKLALTLLLFGLLSTPLTAQDRKEIIEVTVEPYKGLSYGAFFKDLDLRCSDRSAEYIQDFEFEWGYHYVLQVEKTHLAQPPMDASSVTFKLKKVISKTPVEKGYTFQITLENEFDLGPPDQEELRVTLTQQSENVFRYFNEIDIIVPSELYAKFSKVLYQNASRKGTFEFAPDGRIKLIKI